MAVDIVIPYKPREWALNLHNSDKRWKVIVLHRRAGKTVAALNHLQRDALRTNGAFFAYIAPTYKQAKMIAWDMIKEYSRVIPGIKYNESELTVIYPNGSKIRLLGADNPDSLRGIALWGCVFDEYSQQPSNIFPEIVRPALADNKGYAIWIGTPKGHNNFYELYQHSLQDDKWLGLLLTVEETGALDAEEVDDAKVIMSPDEFRQEFYCSFEAAIRGAYYSDQIEAMRREERITTVAYEPNLPVNTYWDLGVNDATTIIFVQFHNGQKRIIDYYENSGEGLAHYAKVLQDKGYVYGKHYAPHDIQVKELGTGLTRLEQARSLGINFLITPNIKVEDGINAARIVFNSCWFDQEKTDKLIESLSQYHKEWDDKRGVFKNQPYHDWSSHAADAFRYFAVNSTREQAAADNLAIY